MKPCWLILHALSQTDCHGSADHLLTTLSVCFSLTGLQKYLLKGKHKGCQTERENKQWGSDSTSSFMDQWQRVHVQINTFKGYLYTNAILQKQPLVLVFIFCTSVSLAQGSSCHCVTSCTTISPCSSLSFPTFFQIMCFHLLPSCQFACQNLSLNFRSLSAAFSLMANFYFMAICRKWIYR